MDTEILSIAKRVAEEGWRANFELKSSGERIESAFITQADFAKGFVVLERIGERDKPPRLLDLRDVSQITPLWD